jgi:hypothetical protein
MIHRERKTPTQEKVWIVGERNEGDGRMSGGGDAGERKSM